MIYLAFMNLFSPFVQHDKLRLWNSSEDISLDVHTKLGEAVDSDVVQEGDCLVLKRG